MFNWFFNIFKVAKKVQDEPAVNYTEQITNKLDEFLNDKSVYLGGLPLTFNNIVGIIHEAVDAKRGEAGLYNQEKQELVKDGESSTTLDYILIASYLKSDTGKDLVLKKLKEKVSQLKEKTPENIKNSAIELFKNDIADDVIRTSKRNFGLRNIIKAKHNEDKDAPVPVSSTETTDDEGNTQNVLDITTDPAGTPEDYVLLDNDAKKGLKKVLYNITHSKTINSDTKQALISWVINVGASMLRAPDFSFDGKSTLVDKNGKAIVSKLPKELVEKFIVLDDVDKQSENVNSVINNTKISVPALSDAKISLSDLDEITDALDKTHKLFRKLATHKEDLFISAGQLLNHFDYVNKIIENIGDDTEAAKDFKKEVDYSKLTAFVDKIKAVPGLEDTIRSLDATFGTDEYKKYESDRQKYYGVVENLFDKPTVEKTNTKEQLASLTQEAKDTYKQAMLSFEKLQQLDKNTDEYKNVSEIYQADYVKYNVLKQKIKYLGAGSGTGSEEAKTGISFKKYLTTAAKTISNRSKYLNRILKKSKAKASADALSKNLDFINKTRAEALRVLGKTDDLTNDEKTLIKKYLSGSVFSANNAAMLSVMKNTIGSSGDRINTEYLNEQFADVLMNTVLWNKAKTVNYLGDKGVLGDDVYETAVKYYRYIFDPDVYVLTPEQREKVLEPGPTKSDALYYIYKNPEEATVDNNVLSEEERQNFLNSLTKGALYYLDRTDRKKILTDYTEDTGARIDTQNIDKDAVVQDLNNGALDRVITPLEAEEGEEILEDLDDIHKQLLLKKDRENKVTESKESTEEQITDIDEKLKQVTSIIKDTELPQEHVQILTEEYFKLENEREKLADVDLQKHENELNKLSVDVENLLDKLTVLRRKLATKDTKSAAMAWADKHALDEDVLAAYEYYYKDGELLPAVEYRGYWFPIYKYRTGEAQLDDTPLKDPVIVTKEDKESGAYLVHQADDIYIKDSETGFYYKANKETKSIEDAVPHKELPGLDSSTQIKDTILKKYNYPDGRSAYLHLLDIYDNPKVKPEEKEVLFSLFETDMSLVRDFVKKVGNNLDLLPNTLYNSVKKLITSDIEKHNEGIEKKKDTSDEYNQSEQDNDEYVEEEEENPFASPERYLGPKRNEPLPLKTQIEEPKTEEESNGEEDVVSPTEEEEVVTTESGFYFGIQKTAEFFKFAESDDGYTAENNPLADKKEQKDIETGMEGFTYQPTEQAKVDDESDNTEFSMEKLGKVLKQVKTKSPEKWQEVIDLVKQSSAKSGDDLAVFMELWANNDWNASAALRAYNASAVEPRDNNYFYSMYERNVWPAIQTMPAVVNIVNSLSKNEVVEPSDVDTNEYKNV